VGWLCYIGSRLQVTQLKNWVSVLVRGRYLLPFWSIQASLLPSGYRGLLAVLGKELCMFLSMCVRCVCVFFFSEGIQEFKEFGPFQQWSNVDWQLPREGLPHDSQSEIFGRVRKSLAQYKLCSHTLTSVIVRLLKVWYKLNFAQVRREHMVNYVCVYVLYTVCIHLLYILYT
jgi:hypothetical protein